MSRIKNIALKSIPLPFPRRDPYENAGIVLYSRSFCAGEIAKRPRKRRDERLTMNAERLPANIDKRRRYVRLLAHDRETPRKYPISPRHRMTRMRTSRMHPRATRLFAVSSTTKRAPSRVIPRAVPRSSFREIESSPHGRVKAHEVWMHNVDVNESQR